MGKKVAVIGGAEHGKPTFIKALGSVFGGDADVIPDDEFRIGKTEAEIEYKGENYVFFEYNSFEGFEENISGTEDAAVMVTDACEGPMFGARELLRLCVERGIENYVIFMNKCDIVNDDELVELCLADTREVFDEEGVFSDDVPAVCGCAKRADWYPESEDGYVMYEVMEALSKLL